MLALMVTLMACASPSAPPILSIKTPIATLAAGEPVLPYSQILLHNAPLPLAADYAVNSHNWTLAGYNTYATRDIAVPNC